MYMYCDGAHKHSGSSSTTSLKQQFGDKDEWRSVLGQLQDEGALTYNRDRDEIVVPLVGAGPPPPAPTPDAV